MIVAAALVLTVLAPAPSRAAAAEARRPNILFIILDDWGWHDAGAYGSQWVKTPTFDRIAREGVLFRHAFTSNPKCSPSRASILTGRHAWQTEEGNVHYSSFPAKFPVYPDLLEQAGYAIGLTGKGWGPGNFAVTGRKHNPAGPSFDAVKQKPPTTAVSTNDYAANFGEFLKTVKAGQPFCFWLGMNEPHRPYQRDTGARGGRDLSSVLVPPYLPDNAVVRGDLLDYALEVEWADAQAGKALAVLEAAGLLDDTLVVMTSDNGMPFPRVKGQIVEDDFHLPLAIRWGGVAQPGKVVEELVDFRDFGPTFLTAAGVPVPDSMSGRSFLSLLEKSPAGEADRPPFAMLVGKERHDLGRPDDAGYPVRAIRTPEWLYVRNYAPERWPAGNPETGFPNVDGGPTKDWVVAHRDRFFELAFGLRPAESLYRIDTDPACLIDRAGDPALAETLADLRGRMEAQLRAEKDPRVLGAGDVFDTYPWYGSRARAYDTWLKKQAGASAVPAGAASSRPQVHLAGDSTMASYKAENPQRGWGMVFGSQFVDPVMVHNHAISGRSTKSFIERGDWGKLVGELQAGDIVIIQFGHNDEKVNLPKTGTDVATEFPANLRRMVRDVRDKQAVALLATPVARRKFDRDGKLLPTHGAYPDAIRAVARELDVPLLDLERDTSAWLQEEGVETSKKFFVGLIPVGNPPKAPAAPDNTHFLEPGAQRVAELAAKEIRALKLPLTRWLK